MTKKKHYSNYSIKKTLIGLLIVFFVVLIGGSCFLLSMDQCHECYRGFIVKYLLKNGNYYDGKTWFSVAATLIGAVISATPGLMCGIFALVQTQRLHDLEIKYHRPVMRIENVKISFVRVKHVSEENHRLYVDGLDVRQRSGVREAGDSAWWIDLEAKMYFDNGIAAEDMQIESVTFSFPDAGSGEKYELILEQPERDAKWLRRFERGPAGDRTANTLIWNLTPFKCKQPDKKQAFEESVRQFAFYHEGRNPRYNNMELSIVINTDFEYGDQMSEQCVLKTFFKAENVRYTGQGGHIIENQSSDGYFTYMR